MSARHRYLVALGSNRRHPRFGSPRKTIAAAAEHFAEAGIELRELSQVIETAPLGPSRRRFANAAALVASALSPLDLLAGLQEIERSFGRRRRGQPWGERVLDLDIVLWSGGVWATADLTIPHPLFRTRAFVLRPLAQIAPDWRDPLTGLTVRQLHARLTRPRAIPRHPAWSGP